MTVKKRADYLRGASLIPIYSSRKGSRDTVLGIFEHLAWRHCFRLFTEELSRSGASKNTFAFHALFTENCKDALKE
ncbi:hypothetical protein QR680_002704 [Steinernema hermaphroditum]|uniref:Uncharacterized protein n=1 Tax=Steinernema hermaphroditum TaxID=289476 RepID=A0AA39LIV4_9BILA|nr:hypothetical protein QR680_002704 [Steinernema hermaphroditum]